MLQTDGVDGALPSFQWQRRNYWHSRISQGMHSQLIIHLLLTASHPPLARTLWRKSDESHLLHLPRYCRRALETADALLTDMYLIRHHPLGPSGCSPTRTAPPLSLAQTSGSLLLNGKPESYKISVGTREFVGRFLTMPQPAGEGDGEGARAGKRFL